LSFRLSVEKVVGKERSALISLPTQQVYRKNCISKTKDVGYYNVGITEKFPFVVAKWWVN
jgi:hypothetical protein